MRIDPAELERLGKKWQEAEQALYDATVKHQEAEIAKHLASEERSKREREYYDYVGKFIPPMPNWRNMP